MYIMCHKKRVQGHVGTVQCINQVFVQIILLERHYYIKPCLPLFDYMRLFGHPLKPQKITMLPVRMLLMWSSPFNAHTNLFFESICKLQILSKFMYLDISLIYFLIVLMISF